MLRRFFKILLFIGAIIILFAIACNVWVVSTTEDQISSSVEELPATNIALVLGTSRLNSTGQNNEYFEKRMDAVLDLFSGKKIDRVLLSGDNRSVYYNEPGDMKKALMKRGLGEDRIELDPAGLRTLDSVVRCKTVFGQNDVIIITQKFHMHRALFIASFYDMTAVGYAAGNPDHSYLNIFLRELVARPLAVLDLYVFHTKPATSNLTMIETR